MIQYLPAFGMCRHRVVIGARQIAVRQVKCGPAVRFVRVDNLLRDLGRHGFGCRLLDRCGHQVLCGGWRRCCWLAVNPIHCLFGIGEFFGGATEATVWSNYFPIDRVDPAWKSIPYGRPIQNARYYVLDPHLSPCPIGVPGDLFIGGDCLASGYANDLERTRERFVHDVFSVDSNAVMYKTGDRARFMPDGNIEFLGRSDNQVKVRGFRIELGEIESALRKHAAVQDVVVATRGERTDKELVAYLAVKEGTSSNISMLRRHLQNLIPEYMIPAQWMFLDRIPMTPNGKVDLKALPDPGNLRPELGEAYLAPRNDLEKVVTRIWCEILGLQTVGVQDRFFDLGGTSLKAVRAVTRIKEELGIEISALAIFETPTIAELVQTLKHNRIETIEAAARDHAAPERNVSPSRRRDVAIVGMAARFPGARNVQEFWVNLHEGRESFTELTEEELRQSGEDEALLRDPNYVRICATIQDVDKFDASFFGINPREAELMDPQHRAFLECAWSALEDAGYDPYTFEGSIGVFGGVARNAYFTSNVVAHPNYRKDSANYTLILGNDKDYPARGSPTSSISGGLRSAFRQLARHRGWRCTSHVRAWPRVTATWRSWEGAGSSCPRPGTSSWMGGRCLRTDTYGPSMRLLAAWCAGAASASWY